MIFLSHTLICVCLFSYSTLAKNEENVLNLDLHFVVIHTWKMLAVFVLPWVLIQDTFSTKNY